MSKHYIKKYNKEGENIYIVKSGAGKADEVNAYLKDKVKDNRSPNTVIRLARSLAYYMDYLDEEGLLVEEIGLMDYDTQIDHFSGFLEYTREGDHKDKDTGRKPSAATSNTYLKDVFGFFEYLARAKDYPPLRVLQSRGYSYFNSLGIMRNGKADVYTGYLRAGTSTHVRPATEDMIRQTLNACTNLRDSLLIALLAETGFRIGELLGVHYTDDIDYDAHRIYVVFRDDNANGAREKNAEERSIVISEGAFALLERYLTDNAEILEKTPYLFITRDGKPLTRRAVYAILARIEKKTGIHLTPHMLRRYFATDRLKRGWDILSISIALGHKRIETTRRYLYLDEDNINKKQKEYLDATRGLFDLEGLIDDDDE